MVENVFQGEVVGARALALIFTIEVRMNSLRICLCREGVREGDAYLNTLLILHRECCHIAAGTEGAAGPFDDDDLGKLALAPLAQA